MLYLYCLAVAFKRYLYLVRWLQDLTFVLSKRGQGLYFRLALRISRLLTQNVFLFQPCPQHCQSQEAREEVKRVNLLLKGNQEVQALGEA